MLRHARHAEHVIHAQRSFRFETRFCQQLLHFRTMATSFDFGKWRTDSELSDQCCDILIAKRLDTVFVLSGLQEGDLKDLKLDLHDKVCLRKAVGILLQAEQRAAAAAIKVAPASGTNPPPVSPRADGSESNGPVIAEVKKETTRSLAQLDKLNQLISGINSNPLDDLLADENPKTDKGEKKALLIVDFLTSFSGAQLVDPPEEVLTTSDGRQISVKAPKKKPSADTLLPHQWIAANGRITKLIQSTRPASEAADYCDFTSMIGDYLKDYTCSSVFWLDHQHRLAVAEQGRRWCDIDSHLKQIHLKLRSASSTSASGTSLQLKKRGRSFPDNVCWNYNSRSGCTYKECKYPHLCGEPGCLAKHPSYKHNVAPRLQNTTSATDS